MGQGSGLRVEGVCISICIFCTMNNRNTQHVCMDRSSDRRRTRQRTNQPVRTCICMCIGIHIFCTMNDRKTLNYRKTQHNRKTQNWCTGR